MNSEILEVCRKACQECRAVCSATLQYCVEVGVADAVLQPLRDCRELCCLALDWMLRGSSLTEEICELAAAGCSAAADTCRAIDNPQMQACANACAACQTACEAMDTDGDVEAVEEDALAMSDHPRMLLALGDAEAAMADALTRIPLLKLGRFAKVERGKLVKFAITPQLMSDVVRNFRKRKADVVLDYEHASMHPGDAKGDLVPAAGWLKTVEDGPDANGILWGRAELTDKAREAVQKKELRYVSPELDGTARDKESGEPLGLTIPSVALTNRPFLEGLPALALSDLAGKGIHGGDAANAKKEKKTVKITHVALTDGNRVRVRVESGEEFTSDGAIQLPASPKVIALSDLQRDEKGLLQFTSLGLSDTEVVSAEVFRAFLAHNELETAIAAGKILPAQRSHFERMALSDLAGFRGLMATMQPQIDLTERGTAVDGVALSDVDKVDAKLHEVAKRKMAENKDLSYSAAFKMALSDRPDLAQARKSAMKTEGR